LRFFPLAGNIRLANGGTKSKKADINLVGIPHSVFKADNLMGDVIFRSVFGIEAGNLVAKHNADRLAGPVLQHACIEKQVEYNEALAPRPGTKCLILGVETGGRMGKDLLELLSYCALT
jgi:hypothetical protein|tara:strand:+ start:5085 stop:5441 length:357 start_codon:yes stop_codon:yes gene_type:complete